MYTCGLGQSDVGGPLGAGIAAGQMGCDTGVADPTTGLCIEVDASTQAYITAAIQRASLAAATAANPTGGPTSSSVTAWLNKNAMLLGFGIAALVLVSVVGGSRR